MDSSLHKSAAASTTVFDNTTSVSTDAARTKHVTTQVAPPKPPPIVSDRRYNVVLFGIDEPSAEILRSDRQKHDLEKLLSIMSSIDASITSASIKDFYRLGKFKQDNTRPRPLLVKFLRAFEATLVLSNKKSLTSGVSIKPDLTLEERKVENALLKERRRLIDNGVERKSIRIRGNCLYLNKKLHGLVQDSEFQLATTSLTATVLPVTTSDSSNVHSIPPPGDITEKSC